MSEVAVYPQPDRLKTGADINYAYWGPGHRNQLVWYWNLDGQAGITLTGVFREGRGVRGMQMLQWIREKYPDVDLYVDGALAEVEGFYQKAMERGFIDGYTLE